MCSTAVVIDLKEVIPDADRFAIDCIEEGDLDCMRDHYLMEVTMVTSNAVIKGSPIAATIHGVEQFRDSLMVCRSAQGLAALLHAFQASITLLEANIFEIAETYQHFQQLLDGSDDGSDDRCDGSDGGSDGDPDDATAGDDGLAG
jgi:hypothetical protein